MKNVLLYFITVLIWGSTWIAIEFQLGEVAIEVSLIYRFGSAALIILIFSLLKGWSLNFSIKQHFFIALLGILNFCLNYVSLYEAQNHLSSAMASVLFSMLLLMNIINTRIFFGKKIYLKTYIGALFGIAGIVILFWPEITIYQRESGTLTGLFYVFIGTLLASLGNMVSVRNSNNNYPLLQTTGFAMFYGTLFLTLIATANNTAFTFSSDPNYLISLIYLSVFGTVIAFYSYFYLLKSIGTEKASYSIVLFPVVAVIISSLYEGFDWTIYTIWGFILVAGGNLILLIPLDKVLLWFKNNSRLLPK